MARTGEVDDKGLWIKDDSGQYIHPDGEPFYLFANEKPRLTYADMRCFAKGVAGIFRQWLLRVEHERRQRTLPPLPPPGEQAKGG